ncbi:hypothetical protein A3E49_03010 [Candidatus Saccharibacteria bacterium RIFCSPHIGHO2_12_FULL_49_19]|nr:MAG: hypothetical protein A2708_00525 [Candidatus Saccharibacteria bacterium RIFCSPHIGHO2_01_FULL_49_21]OGL36346.1 MAG: hypothetical protein A3E49_03010 [Candidatus Saccharibacteria bacterium RIFCSPHIGHO2_12_FULL_49_19]OGL37249.1 MAG: hypothetical protein A3B63_01885 [Candidatus Saccharibacteria bacterium RIFCSPLOWO2_01_FULL_49_22]
MIKLIIAGLIAALVASGLYAYIQFGSDTKSSEEGGSQVENPIDALQGANEAIQQQTDRANDIQQKAQQQENPYNY